MTAADLQALLDAGRRVDLAEPVTLDRPLYLSGVDDRITLTGRGDATPITANGPGLMVLPRAFRFTSAGQPRDFSSHFVSGSENRYGFRTRGNAILTYPGSAAALGPTGRGLPQMGYGIVRQLQLDVWAEANEPAGWDRWHTFCGAAGDQNNPSPVVVGHNDGNTPWLEVRLADGRREVFRWHVADPSVRDRVFSWRVDLDGGQVGLSIDGGDYEWRGIPGWSAAETPWPYHGGPFQIGAVSYSGGYRFSPPDWTCWGLRLRTAFADVPSSTGWHALPADPHRLFQLIPSAPDPGSLVARCYGPVGWGQGFVQVVDPAMLNTVAVRCEVRDVVFHGNGDQLFGAGLLAATCRGGVGLSIRDCEFTSYAYGVLTLPLAGQSYPVRLEHVVCFGQWGSGVEIIGGGWGAIEDVIVYHPGRVGFRGMDGGCPVRDLKVMGGTTIGTIEDAVRLEQFEATVRDAAFNFEDTRASPRRSYVYAERCRSIALEDSDGGVPAGMAEVVLGEPAAGGSRYRIERSFVSTPGRVACGPGWAAE